MREKSYTYEDMKELDKYLRFVDEPYVIIVVKFIQNNGNEENSEAIKIALSVILNSVFGTDIYIHNLMRAKTVVLVPLNNSIGRTLDVIKKKLYQAIMELKQGYLIDARAGISLICIGYDGIHEGYEQAMEALRFENGSMKKSVFICK